MWWGWWLFGAAVLAAPPRPRRATVAGPVEEGGIDPEIVIRAKLVDPGLTTFGEEGMWKPFYAKRRGCRDFRFGACFGGWLDEIRKRTPSLTAAEDALQKLLERYNPAPKWGPWIRQRRCVRFTFPLEGVEDEAGGGAFVVSRERDQVLAAAAPTHPLPPKSGLERVWVRVGDPNRTQSPYASTTLFPNGDLWESLGESQIRDLLSWRSDEGLLSLQDLRDAGCGESKWRLALRSFALKEWD